MEKETNNTTISEIEDMNHLKQKKNIQEFKKLLVNNPLFYSVFIGSIIIIIALIAPITFLYYEASNALTEKAEVFEKYVDAQKDLNTKNESLYALKLKSAFTKEELIKLIDKVTTYTFLVNNNPVTKDSLVQYSTTSKTLITFYEKYNRSAYEVIPKSLLLEFSRINKKDIDNLMKIYTNEAKYTAKEQFYEDGRKLYIQFDKVKTGEIITIDFETDFAKILGINEGTVEIFHNKVENK